MRLISGEAKTLSDISLNRVPTVKAMVFQWAYDRSTCPDPGDFEVRFIHRDKVLSDRTSLAKAGVMPGDEITVIGQKLAMPDLVSSSDDEYARPAFVSSSDDSDDLR